jgi:hypothetical protein
VTAKVCGRCYEPIKADEEYTTYTPVLATTAAPDVYQHVRLCLRAPTQTYPLTSRR